MYNTLTEMVRLSKKYQVVIPRGVRKKLGIEGGDELIVEAIDGKVVMRLRPRNYTQHMRGLYRKLWSGVKADEYVEREREAWQTRSRSCSESMRS